MFSEYLPTLGLITCVLHFPEDISSIKSIKVNDKNELVISTENLSKTGLLPVPSDPNTAKITNLKKLNEDLTVVVKLATSEANKISFNTVTKWSCRDLLTKTEQEDGVNKFSFQCSKCHFTLLNGSDYKFMDMPSEFWYELMDFWHCHKPTTHEKSFKNYNGILKPPNSTTVILGSYYLSLGQKTDTILVTNKEVTCKQCNEVLGEADDNSIRLLKWKLELESGGKIENFPQSLIIYNSILDKINSLAVRKIKFEVDGVWWYVWVMNVGLNVTVNNETHQNCMKVLYVEDVNGICTQPIFDDYEQFTLVYPEIIETLTSKLKSVNRELPKLNQVLVVNGIEFSISYLTE